VVILHIQICYADYNYDIKLVDYNDYFNEVTINFSEIANNSDDCVYQDIKGCSLQNHLINRKVSKINNIFIFLKFFFFFCMVWLWDCRFFFFYYERLIACILVGLLIMINILDKNKLSGFLKKNKKNDFVLFF